MTMKHAKKALFKIFVDGVESAAFMKCSPLRAEFAMSEVYEGGALIPVKEKVRLAFDDITLERGVTTNEDLYNLFASSFKPTTDSDVGNSIVGSGSDDDGEFGLQIQDLTLARNAFSKPTYVSVAAVKAFNAGEWDNDSDDAQVEKITLSINYFQKGNSN